MREVSKNQKDEHRYDDMIHMEHHVSGTHRPLSMSQRAAQFAPFAALTGYGEAISESSRLTQHMIEMSDEEKQNLNVRLQILKMHEKERPEVTVTYFEEDDLKEGGAYQQITKPLRRIDGPNFIFEDRTSIELTNIITIECEHFRGIDE